MNALNPFYVPRDEQNENDRFGVSKQKKKKIINRSRSLEGKRSHQRILKVLSGELQAVKTALRRENYLTSTQRDKLVESMEELIRRREDIKFNFRNNHINHLCKQVEHTLFELTDKKILENACSYKRQIESLRKN